MFSATNCNNKIAPKIKTIHNQAVVRTSQKENIVIPNVYFTTAGFTIIGMICTIGCAANIEKQLSRMEGIKSAKVNFEKELALVEYDDAQVNPELLMKTVTKVSKE